jgi:hypothetical protein
LGLRATLYLTDPRAHDALLVGDLDEFFSFVYAVDDRPNWVDQSPLDLDKSWHVIHFLVTGDRSTTFLLDGYQVPIIEEHFESHSPASIGDTFRKINGRSAAQILDGCCLDNLNEVGIYDGTWEESALPFLLEKLSEFIEKIATATAEDRGLFVTIT